MKLLHDREVIFLSRIVALFQANGCSQNWISVRVLDLPEPAKRELGLYIANLAHAKIQLEDREDVLICDSDSGGRYTPKAWYIKLIEVGNQQEVRWW